MSVADIAFLVYRRETMGCGKLKLFADQVIRRLPVMKFPNLLRYDGNQT